MFPNYCDNPKHLVTFPNAPWGIVSLPNFENHWVPNTHSHLINIAHTHTVHQMLAWLVPSSQSWEWVSLYQTIFLSYSGGRFKDASTLAAPTVARFFRGFSTEICCRVPCVSHLHDSAPRGFLSSQRATIQSVPTIQKFRYPSSLKSPQINPAGSSPPPEIPYYFMPGVDKLPIKDQRVSILGSVGHMVSVANPQTLSLQRGSGHRQ